MEDTIGYIETAKHAGTFILEQKPCGVTREKIADVKVLKTSIKGKLCCYATVTGEQTTHLTKALTNHIPKEILKPFDLQER